MNKTIFGLALVAILILAGCDGNGGGDAPPHHRGQAPE